MCSEEEAGARHSIGGLPWGPLAAAKTVLPTGSGDGGLAGEMQVEEPDEFGTFAPPPPPIGAVAAAVLASDAEMEID